MASFFILGVLMYEVILTDVRNHILTITLNRPDHLNSINLQMFLELMDVFDKVNQDDEVRCIIITGAGKAFCAGADLSGGGNTFKHESDTNDEIDFSDPKFRDGGGILTLKMFDCLKPIICAINGPAVGIGITLTLAADIRMAAENAKMGFVFARRGIVAECCSSWFLPRIVNISHALDWTMSGRIFDAKEAYDSGLVSSLHSADELINAAREKAHQFIDNTSSISVALTRQMMWRMLGADHPMEAHKIDSRGLFSMGRSQEAQEGINSFLEKRSPKFPGKVSKDMPSFFPWWKDREYE